MKPHKSDLLKRLGEALAYAGIGALFQETPRNRSILDPHPAYHLLSRLLNIDFTVLNQFRTVFDLPHMHPKLLLGMEETPGYYLAEGMKGLKDISNQWK